jgi:hypothetical protein
VADTDSKSTEVKMNTEAESSSSIVLKFDAHHSRLGNIAWLARFLDGAIERAANALPNEVEFINAQEKMVASFQMFGECVEPPHQFDPEEIKSCLLTLATPSESSRALMYSLCLVMLVTQVEIFIERLIDVILLAEPRRLKDLAGDQQLNFRDLVDAQNYESVMASARKKVVKKVLDSSIREILEKHLGQRFTLFEKESLTCTTLEESGEEKAWGIAEIETIWNTRHQVVHEGKLNVNRSEFEQALFGCAWIETFLSLRARDTYGIIIDSTSKLDTLAPYYDKAQPHVLFSLQIGWGISGLFRQMKIRKN